MAVLYRDSDLEALLTPALALEALEEAFRLEAQACTTVPGRLNADAPGGWIRLMPAAIDADDGRAALGFKAMNLNESTGVRYITIVYDAESGDMQAIMDAGRLTRIRTAAVTALACRYLRSDAPREIGLFGSGYEASGHAETLRAAFPELARIVVYSPRPERREEFAERHSESLGIEVRATADPEEAAAMPVVVLATKAREPVLSAGWLQPGALVLSIGSTRLDLRELDEQAFARSRWCVGDSPAQLIAESGDVRAALEGGCLDEQRLVPLSAVIAGEQSIGWPPDDLLIFKSVGTALQDLAVSRAVHRAGVAADAGLDLGRFPVLH